MSNSAARTNSSPQQVNLRLRPIAAAISTLLLPMAAFAEDAAPAAADAAPQTIVVTGIRHSIESSVATKRNSESIVEAVSAEDIGKLPDISIAESLARLPGLAGQSVDGRTQVIAIRGMSPDFAGTLLNGREQTTTGLNRGVEFDQYPAELMASVVVYKTPDAALLGQGLSGTVDLRAIRPLDLTERKIAFNGRVEKNSLGDLNHGYGDTSDKGGRFSASYIDQFANHTVGVALGFAHLDTPGQEQHYKAWWWGAPGGSWYNGATALGGAEVEALSRKDVRDGLMGVFEFKPNKDFHSTIDTYYSTFKQKEVMRGIMWDSNPWCTDQSWTCGQPNKTISNPGYSMAGGTTILSSGILTFPVGSNQPVVRNDYNTRDDRLVSIGWNTEGKVADWRAIADLSYSSAKRNESLFETYAGTPTSSIQFNIPTNSSFPTFTPSLNFADPTVVALGDPGKWGHDGRKQDADQNDVLKAYNFHGKHELGGIFNEIDLGVDFTRRDKTRGFHVDFATLKNGATTQLIAPGQAQSPVSLGFAGIPGVLSYDVNAMAGQYYNMTPNMSGGPTGDFGKDFGVHEKIRTAYAKADIDTEVASLPLHGNVGVQLIHTDQSSDAFTFADNGSPPNGTITKGATYNDTLPSLNLSLEVPGNRKVRLGIAKTLARPRINDLNAASSASVDATTHTWSGSGGNPQLEPWRATSYDLSLEQYWGKRSYVAGALFYKKLDTYIYQKTISQDFSGYVNPTPSVQPFSNIGFYTTQANGSGGSMRGLELSAVIDGALLTQVLDGFGAIASYSRTDTTIQVNGPAAPGQAGTQLWETLPGLSKNVASMTLYYEKHGYSVRISDRYRSDFRGEFNYLYGATSLARTLAKNTVDFQAGYEFEQGPAKGMSVVFQILNLTNSADRTVQDGSGFGGATAPQEYNLFGRQYLLGLNYKL